MGAGTWPGEGKYITTDFSWSASLNLDERSECVLFLQGPQAEVTEVRQAHSTCPSEVQ